MNEKNFERNMPPPDGIHDDVEFTPIKFKEMSKGKEVAIILLGLFSGMMCVVAVIMEVTK